VLIVVLVVLCLMTPSLWGCCTCIAFGQALLIMGIIVLMYIDWGIMNIEVIPTLSPTSSVMVVDMAVSACV
jgi:hypothetical protein